MRLTASLPIHQNTLINVQRVNQSIAKRIGVSQEDQQSLKRDSLRISPQGRASSLIENLMKQKLDINERKGQVLASAVEKGQSKEAIQSQLDLYDEQIKNIDKQISEITVQLMKEEAEKQQPKIRDKQPKTKEDIQNQKLANITKMSMSLDKMDTISAVKTNLDGNVSTLKSEIKVDKIRSEGVISSKELIEKKEELLSEMETRSLNLISDIGEQFSEVTKIIDENNNLVSDQSEEDIDTSTLDNTVKESKDPTDEETTETED